MIKYLVKFVPKEEFADYLLSGKLYMHCARYYHNLERIKGPGQGDLREGTVFPDYAFYMNTSYPVYCMYIIEDNDILNGFVEIDSRIIEDFDCKYGYFVIIQFDLFEKAMSKCNTNGYRIDGGKVHYIIPNQEDIKRMITSEIPINLFIKNPYFKYQKEYRFVVLKDLYKEGLPDSLNEERVGEYFLADPITAFAKKAPVSFLKKTKNGLLLNLKEL